MQLCKAQHKDARRCRCRCDGHVRFLTLEQTDGIRTLGDILHAENPLSAANGLLDVNARRFALEDVTLLAPVDHQEVWAAGVTYTRSKQARERESVGAARFYDLVYTAERPELFFKATAERVIGPGGRVRVRKDSKWSVPEPELALYVSPRLKIVGYTIGNDMSARDIEGENPLYLPQAKVYDGSCSLGPVVTLTEGMPPLAEVAIHVAIERGGRKVFDGSTSVGKMARKLEDLVGWLGRDNGFPHGSVLSTGTGWCRLTTLPRQRRHGPLDITGIGRLSGNSCSCRATSYDRVDHLTKRFPLSGGGERTAVEDVSFSVAAGEVMASGMAGNDRAANAVRAIAADEQEGHRRWISIPEFPDEAKRRVGPFDTADCTSGSAFGKCFNSCRSLRRAADVAEPSRTPASAFGLTEFLDQRCVVEHWTEQRVNLSRALIHDPRVLLLDEPTLGLDVLGSQAVREYIAYLRTQGKAVILTTHRLDEAEGMCDRFGLLHRGKLVSEGTLDELRARTGCATLVDMFLQLSHIGPVLAHSENESA